MNVLFLCTQNSARSILAECLLNRLGRGRLRGFSAGSQPRGEIHPMALDVLRREGFDTGRLRSKSWQEFAAADAPQMDAVITVCDSAAREVCPVWPGHPVKVHWGLPDPASAAGGEEERRKAFEDTLRILTRRLSELTALPTEVLDQAALRERLGAIGRSDPAGEKASAT